MAAEPKKAAFTLGKVRPDVLACGCHVKVAGGPEVQGGEGSRTALFTGLETKDPLHLNLDGEDLVLTHTAHTGISSKGDRGGRWVDEYRSDSLRVRLRYWPGPDTCPKKGDETCEYQDYGAEVLVIKKDAGEARYKARAVCGC